MKCLCPSSRLLCKSFRFNAPMILGILVVTMTVLSGCLQSRPVAATPYAAPVATAVTGQVQLGQLLLGHKGKVYSVAFSPDGGTLASSSQDGTIILWDMATRQPLGEPLTGHTSLVYGVAFSPDGSILASSSADKSIILWDVKTGQPLGKPLLGHSGDVDNVAFSPNGSILASSSEDRAVILWDLNNPASPEAMTVLRESVDSVSSASFLAFSPEGRLLAGGSYEDKGIILWDVSNPKSPVHLGASLGGGEGYWSVAFSPDGQILAAAGESGSVALWDVSAPLAPVSLGTSLRGHEFDAMSVAFSSDGRLLATGSSDETVVLWEVSNLKAPMPLGILRGQAGEVGSVAFSPDGKLLASGSYDSSVILWDVSDPKVLALSLTPTPAVPLATMGSLSKEIVQLLCEQQPHADIIERTTEKEGTVQVWNCREPLVEIPRGSWSLPAMDYCRRTCSDDFSTNWEVYFQIQSPTQATAQVCSVGGYSIVCDRLRLTRADDRWTVVSEGSYTAGNCDCPTAP